jgi:hypothetical protein
VTSGCFRSRGTDPIPVAAGTLLLVAVLAPPAVTPPHRATIAPGPTTTTVFDAVSYAVNHPNAAVETAKANERTMKSNMSITHCENRLMGSIANSHPPSCRLGQYPQTPGEDSYRGGPDDEESNSAYRLSRPLGYHPRPAPAHTENRTTITSPSTIV